MSNTDDAPAAPRSGRHWVEAEDYLPRKPNAWIYVALVFWGVAIPAAMFGIWPLAATAIITGTIAGVRSR